MKQSIMKILSNHWKQILIVLLLIPIIFLVDFCKRNYRGRKLKEYEETFAVFDGISRVIGSTRGVYIFKTKSGALVETEISYNKLNKGDTIWIKYSIDDPTVAELVDKDYSKYMKKKQ